MLVSSRRGLIINAGALLLYAPVLVKASSLDAVFRGPLLDPWVIAWNYKPGCEFSTKGPRESYYNRSPGDEPYKGVDWCRFSPQKRAEWLNSRSVDYSIEWTVMRKSEVQPLFIWGDT